MVVVAVRAVMGLFVAVVVVAVSIVVVVVAMSVVVLVVSLWLYLCITIDSCYLWQIKNFHIHLFWTSY